jgi:hypothetical protein
MAGVRRDVFNRATDFSLDMFCTSIRRIEAAEEMREFCEAYGRVIEDACLK